MARVANDTESKAEFRKRTQGWTKKMKRKAGIERILRNRRIKEARAAHSAFERNTLLRLYRVGVFQKHYGGERADGGDKEWAICTMDGTRKTGLSKRYQNIIYDHYIGRGKHLFAK